MIRSLRRQRRYQQSRHRPLRLERLERRDLLAANVYITEILASNNSGLRDGDGDSSDWIEFYNAGDESYDLSGHYLTDDETELTKWQFPSDTVIAPDQYLIVFASNKDTSGPAGEIHTNFALSAGGEYLGWLDPDGVTVIQEFSPEFPPQETNIAYGLSMSGNLSTLVDDATSMRYLVPTDDSVDATWTQTGFDDAAWESASAGIGYEASPGGINDYTALLDAQVPSGTTTAYTRFEFELVDPAIIDTLTLGMIYDDGFAAYLNGSLVATANTPASLAWDSTAGNDPERGDEVVLEDFVEFNISEFVWQLQVGTNVLAIHALNQAPSSDMLMIPQLTAGTTTIDEPVIFGYLAEPTPAAPNGSVFVGLVQDTNFTVDRGFYSAPFEVEISSETPGATIVYTTDGSAPSVDSELNITNGMLYTGAIVIDRTTNLRAAAFKQGFRPTNTDTQTYLFTSDVIQQTYASALAAGLPSSWGGRSADYGLDPDVIGPNDDFGGVYAAIIEDTLKAIPTISLTLNNKDFFGPTGIYANVEGRGVAWERPASAELIFPDGSEGFQIDAGLRIHGAASRVLSRKNGLRLLFKADYGSTKLKYPLFGEEGVTKFDTIVLRPHFNDGWGWDGALDDPLYIRDQWFRDTQAAMGHASARGNVVHLYVNGLYWGLYNPSERPDDSFAAEHFGGEKEEYDVVNHDGLHKGSIDAYNKMLGLTEDVISVSGSAARNAAYQHLQGKLPDGTNDPTSDNYLDITNYIDYMILNHYGGNNDWPDRNWFANRRRGIESEGYRFYAWDSEISLALSSRTSLFENNVGHSVGAAEAYGILRDYEEFRLQFADRIHHHLFNGGALYVNPDSPEYDPANPQDNVPAARFDALSKTVYEAMVAESARWGDQHVSTPRTRDIEWQSELDYMLGTYFTERHDIVLDQWRAAGLYPSIDAPEFEVDGSRQHGGTVTAGGILSFENPNSPSEGTIYYTIDGTDPRLVGGGINTESAFEFSSEFQLFSSTRIKARVLYDGVWSAVTDAEFTVTTIDNADFNGNGIVDAADYVAWRTAEGNTGAPGLPGDADNSGTVDDVDYQIWRSLFGTASVAPATTNSPLLSRQYQDDSTDSRVAGFHEPGVEDSGDQVNIASVNAVLDFVYAQFSRPAEQRNRTARASSSVVRAGFKPFQTWEDLSLLANAIDAAKSSPDADGEGRMPERDKSELEAPTRYHHDAIGEMVAFSARELASELALTDSAGHPTIGGVKVVS